MDPDWFKSSLVLSVWMCFPCLCGGHRLTGDSKLTVCVCLCVRACHRGKSCVYSGWLTGDLVDDERFAKNQRIPELMTKVFVSLELKLYSIQ